MMSLLICVSKDFTNKEKLFEECDTVCKLYFKDAIVVCGCSSLAFEYASSRGYDYKGFYLPKGRYNSYAVSNREYQMQKFISEFQHKFCLAFGSKNKTAEAYASRFGNQYREFR